MASTFSNTGLELIATGEQSGTWGTTTNENWELIEEMVAGVVSISLSSTTYTLTTTDGASSNGRHAVIVFTGSPGGTCTVTVSPNNMQKVYFIVNNSDETVTLSQGSGANVSVSASKTKVVYCDGAGAGAAVVDLTTTLADLGITATAAELNILDGVTSTTAELNILDGVTSTTAELNILDGVTATAAELNILDGVTATATELNLLDGVTATTAELNYVDGVTSSIQTQLDAKVAKTSSTGSAVLPAGTTAERDGSPSAGYLRWNSDDTSAEVYDGSAWAAVGGGNTTDEGLYEMANTISANYTITSGNNAMSAGPITVASGVSVSVPTGSRWVIV